MESCSFNSTLKMYLKEHGQNQICSVSCVREKVGKCPRVWEKTVKKKVSFTKKQILSTIAMANTLVMVMVLVILVVMVYEGDVDRDDDGNPWWLVKVKMTTVVLVVGGDDDDDNDGAAAADRRGEW